MDHEEGTNEAVMNLVGLDHCHLREIVLQFSSSLFFCRVQLLPRGGLIDAPFDWSAVNQRAVGFGFMLIMGGGAEPTSLRLSVSHGVEDVPPLHLQLGRRPLTPGLFVAGAPRLLLQQLVNHAPRPHRRAYSRPRQRATAQ